MAINGNNIIVYQGSTAIAGTRSNEIETDCEVIEISSSTQGEWREYIKGRKEWSVNTSFLVSGVSDITALLTVGTTYTLVFKGRNETNGLSGSAILTKCRITATRGNLVQGSFAFKGNGPLAQ